MRAFGCYPEVYGLIIWGDAILKKKIVYIALEIQKKVKKIFIFL